MNSSTQGVLISIIICSIDPIKFKAISRNYSELLKGERFEIIGIHDAKSLCEGYNRGVSKSTGAIVIFSHDDIEILTPDFIDRVKDHLSHSDIIGVAGTSKLISYGWMAAGHPYIHGVITHSNYPYKEYIVTVYSAEQTLIENIQALDGVFLAVRRSVLETIAFDEQTFDGFHLYDIDFTYSAYLAGLRLAVCNDITLIHYSGGKFDHEWRNYGQHFLAKFQGKLQIGNAGKTKKGGIVCQNRAEIVEMMSPRILAQVTDDIRRKAGLQDNKATNFVDKPAVFSRFLRWLLGGGKLKR